MTEITPDNFEEFYPILEKCLNTATFIALDNEMSGLKSENWSTESLFDTPAERYVKIKKNIDSFIIMQTGLTTFRHVRDENKFIADSFNFYLMPRSIPIKNRLFLWQVCSIEFLAQHGFDFNKFAYKSLSYLNEDEEKDLRENVYNDTFLKVVGDFIPLEISKDVEKKVNIIHEWNNKITKPYEVLELDAETPLIEYLLHKEIRRRFNNIWTKVGVRKVMVIKVKNEEKNAFLSKEKNTVIDDRLINYYIGFTKVFKLLVSLKKPIVGHNLLLDLMFMFKQFYKPLPNSYFEFKNEIHNMFPFIYDTKHMSFNLGSCLKKEEKWKNNGLGEMYTYFREEKGQSLAMYTPIIEKNQSFQFLDTHLKIHDASWDSYYAGYIFIKMSHVFAVKKFGSGAELKYLTCSELMSSVKIYLNNINIIRALVSHVNMPGPDPVSQRPQWLYAQLLTSTIKDISELTEKLSSFGNVDVKPTSSRNALIAVGNHVIARDILKHFKMHKEVCIVPYNPLFHSKVSKYTFWSGVCIAGSFLVWTFFENISKPSHTV